jgi:serine/threonine-protein phosphatase Stp1
LVESGIVRSEDAETHPQRHILTAALGVGIEIMADSDEQGIALEEGDSLVLCTDGLWGSLSEQELGSIVNENTPAKACAALVDMALKRGGPDNITVQILRLA